MIASNNAKKKGHEPTIAYFRGQADTCKKLLSAVNELESQMTIGIWLSPMSLAILAVGGIMVWLLH